MKLLLELPLPEVACRLLNLPKSSRSILDSKLILLHAAVKAANLQAASLSYAS